MQSEWLSKWRSSLNCAKPEQQAILMRSCRHPPTAFRAPKAQQSKPTWDKAAIRSCGKTRWLVNPKQHKKGISRKSPFFLLSVVQRLVRSYINKKPIVAAEGKLSPPGPTDSRKNRKQKWGYLTKDSTACKTRTPSTCICIGIGDKVNTSLGPLSKNRWHAHLLAERDTISRMGGKNRGRRFLCFLVKDFKYSPK